MTPRRRVVLVNLALFGIGAVWLLSQTPVQDYLLSRSPHERLMNHFKEFERKAARDPDIHRALENIIRDEDRSAKLMELSRDGTTRLDSATLLERARILSVVYAHMSDRACADFERDSGSTANDAAELEQALIALEVQGVSRWMDCLYKAMRAEVRKDPEPIVTRSQVVAAFAALEEKIGTRATIRVDEGVNVHSSDAELAWAARTIYRIAPTLPAPHGAVLLRMMEGAYREDEGPPVPRH